MPRRSVPLDIIPFDFRNMPFHAKLERETHAIPDLNEKFKIDIDDSVSIVDGDKALYRPLVKAFHNLGESHWKTGNNQGPFSKVLIVNVHNSGDPDSDYESADSDDE